MSLTLHHGPAGSDKLGLLLKNASQNLSQSSKTAFIVPNRFVSLFAETELARFSSAGGFLSKHRVVTFDDFLLHLLKTNVSRLHVLTPRMKRTIARRLIAQNKYPTFKDYLYFPQLLSKLLNTIDLLKHAGLGVTEARKLFENHQTPEINACLNFFEDYQHVLSENYFADTGELYRLTLDLLKNKKLKCPYTSLYVSRHFPLERGKEEILRLLNQNFPNLSITLDFSFNHASSDDAFFYPAYTRLGEMAEQSKYFNVPAVDKTRFLHAFSHPGIELEALVKKLKNKIDAGVLPSAITVIIPQQAYYKERVPELLHAASLPFITSFQAPLTGAKPLPEEFQNKQGQFSLSEIMALNTAAAYQQFEEEWDFEKKLLLEGFNETRLLELWKKDEREAITLPYPQSKDGIKVLTLDVAHSLDSEHLFVTGFTRKNFSENISDHPFFDTEMLEAPYMREILLSPTYLHERHKHWLDHLLLRVRQSTYLSYPQVSWDKKQETPQTGTYQIIKESDPTAVKTSQEPIHYPALKENRFSITSLDLYLKCPYKYYARYILNLEDKKEDDTDITPDVKGMFIHRVLERLYRENTELYKDALEYDLYLNKLADQTRQIIEDEKPVFLKTSQLPQIVVSDFIKRAEGAIVELVKNEVLALRDKKKTTFPHVLEWAFGSGKVSPFKIRYRDHDIFVTGRIDRIDINEGKKSFTVIDYKTGEIDSTQSLKNAESIQIPLYQMAIQNLLLPRYTSSQGVLLSLKEVGKKSALVFGDNADTDMAIKGSKISNDEWDSLKKRVCDIIGEAALGINKGLFNPAPRNQSLCTTCSYKQICHYQAVDTEEDAA
ncbi:PD-(D/E)XK nuclease family protein [bacterium]|nr:PD-(D/E)XK nuclease family protein [bacterium]